MRGETQHSLTLEKRKTHSRREAVLIETESLRVSQSEIGGTLERTNMRSFTLVLAAVALTTPFFVAVNGAGFRCGFLSFLGTDWACRQSCKIQGHVSSSIFILEAKFKYTAVRI